MGKKVRVNVRALANTTAARNEQRNGREVVVVPSATLPDDVIMNGVKYPAEEIAKSFKSLDRTPAPAGHPTVNGQFVSARDPEGINRGWIGAWNENARQENGRVFLDKVIDVERANQSEHGRAILAAVAQGEPVHTSTGLYCTLDVANGAQDHKHVARDIVFDHDAILLNEDGAATPDQGVGMMVNKASKDGEEIEVINSALADAESDLDWAADIAVRAVEKLERAPLVERIKTAIKEALSSDREATQLNTGDNDMADNKQLEEGLSALTTQVNTLQASLKPLETLGETLANALAEGMKPVTDHMAAIQANQKADEDAKRATAVNSLVKTGAWTEDDLKDMPLAAINKLVEKAKPGGAANLNGSFQGNSQDLGFGDVDLNKIVEGK